MTQLDIFNQAMIFIGEPPIDAANFKNTSAYRACEVMWLPTLRAVQACINWNELERLTEIYPTGKHDMRGVEYSKPENYIRIIKLEGTRTGDNFREEGAYIYISNKYGEYPEHIKVKYIALEENPDAWSVELSECIVELLAANVYATITKRDGSQLKEHFWQITRPRMAAIHLRRTQPDRKYSTEKRFN